MNEELVNSKRLNVPFPPVNPLENIITRLPLIIFTLEGEFLHYT